MARTAFYAPAHRILSKTNQPSAASQPAQAAPSIDFGGSGIQDTRLGYNSAGGANGYSAIGWLGPAGSKVTAQVPSAIAVANIAAAHNPASGVALPLVTTTGAGITVLATAFTPWPNFTNKIPAGAVAIDGLPNVVAFGTDSNRCGLYDPTAGIARCVSVSGVASGSGGTVTIHGADWYGFPMTQTVTLAAGANTVNTLKAFKFITSVVPNFTDTHAISVGTADVFGLNIAAGQFDDCTIFWNGVLALLATFTPAVATTASATTGDVRGTFAASSASDGTKRLAIILQPALARIAAVPQATGIFGVSQF